MLVTRLSHSALRTGSIASRTNMFNFVRHASHLPPSIPDSELFPKDPTGDRPIKAYNTSGVPETITKRAVRIYKPCKNAMQSGKENTKQWRIDFDTQDRWENQLMGWISSADPVQSHRLVFETKEQAVDFAKRQGYHYWIEEPKSKDFYPKSYSDNFKYEPKHLRIIRTK